MNKKSLANLVDFYASNDNSYGRNWLMANILPDFQDRKVNLLALDDACHQAITELCKTQLKIHPEWTGIFTEESLIESYPKTIWMRITILIDRILG